MAIGILGQRPTEIFVGRLAQGRRSATANRTLNNLFGEISQNTPQAIDRPFTDNFFNQFGQVGTLGEKSTRLRAEVQQERGRLAQFARGDNIETSEAIGTPGADAQQLFQQRQQSFQNKEGLSELFGLSSQVFEGAPGPFQELLGDASKLIQSKQAVSGTFNSQAGAAAESAGIAGLKTQTAAGLIPGLFSAADSPDAFVRARPGGFALSSNSRTRQQQLGLLRGGRR